MLIQTSPRLIADRVFVGSQEHCQPGSKEFAVVHACKTPCHQHAVKYSGSLPVTHDHYLWLEQDDDLFLNVIDPPVPMFRVETFRRFLDFCRKHDQQNILIHCNQGLSRAPSFALVWLAKGLQSIPNWNYGVAYREFIKLDPKYDPGKGIRIFLEQHWDEIV